MLPLGRTSMRIYQPNGRSMSMVEHRDTLYMLSKDKIFASSDDGETWRAYCPRPDGDPIGLIITDEPQGVGSRIRTTMYLVLRG